MSVFHGGYSLGTLIGAGAMSVLFTFGLVPLWSVVLCMALTLLALVLGCRDLLPADELKQAEPVIREKRTKFYIPPMVIVAGIAVFCLVVALVAWRILRPSHC